MHIPDKPRLFSRLYDLLDPGGRLVITDYARGTGAGSPEFQAYVEQTGYHLVRPGQLRQAPRRRRLRRRRGRGRHRRSSSTSSSARPTRLAANRADFLASFSEEDLNYLVERWAMKVGFCQAGDMKWGIYQADRTSRRRERRSRRTPGPATTCDGRSSGPCSRRRRARRWFRSEVRRERSGDR